MSRSVAVFVTALGVLCTVALSSAQEALSLPDGVTHIVLPPGTLQVKRVFKGGKPLLRLNVGKTVIHARSLFLGDGKHATKFEAVKGGIQRARGKKSDVFDGDIIYDPGDTIEVLGGGYVKVDQLKPGSVYLTTPSIKFKFKPTP
jgi:hypothetical protein